jgi:hypothetical protein
MLFGIRLAQSAHPLVATTLPPVCRSARADARPSKEGSAAGSVVRFAGWRHLTPTSLRGWQTPLRSNSECVFEFAELAGLATVQGQVGFWAGMTRLRDW